jgi:hypothetical protein
MPSGHLPLRPEIGKTTNTKDAYPPGEARRPQSLGELQAKPVRLGFLVRHPQFFDFELHGDKR